MAIRGIRDSDMDASKSACCPMHHLFDCRIIRNITRAKQGSASRLSYGFCGLLCSILVRNEIDCDVRTSMRKCFDNGSANSATTARYKGYLTDKIFLSKKFWHIRYRVSIWCFSHSLQMATNVPQYLPESTSYLASIGNHIARARI